jgi:putative DNA primase/helicase
VFIDNSDGIAALKAARAKPPPSRNPDEALSGTEDEVALEFSRRHADSFRYVKLWSQWLRWDGAIWRRVENLRVFHLVRRVAREFAHLHDDKKLGKEAATAAVERMARNDPRHDLPPDIWNTSMKTYGTPPRGKARS